MSDRIDLAALLNQHHLKYFQFLCSQKASNLEQLQHLLTRSSIKYIIDISAQPAHVFVQYFVCARDKSKWNHKTRDEPTSQLFVGVRLTQPSRGLHKGYGGFLQKENTIPKKQNKNILSLLLIFSLWLGAWYCYYYCLCCDCKQMLNCRMQMTRICVRGQRIFCYGVDIG